MTRIEGRASSDIDPAKHPDQFIWNMAGEIHHPVKLLYNKHLIKLSRRIKDRPEPPEFKHAVITAIYEPYAHSPGTPKSENATIEIVGRAQQTFLPKEHFLVTANGIIYSAKSAAPSIIPGVPESLWDSRSNPTPEERLQGAISLATFIQGCTRVPEPGE